MYEYFSHKLFYLRPGAGRASVLVNPIAKTLEVYRLSDSAWTLLHTFVDGDVVRAEPFIPEAPQE